MIPTLTDVMVRRDFFGQSFKSLLQSSREPTVLLAISAYSRAGGVFVRRGQTAEIAFAVAQAGKKKDDAQSCRSSRSSD